MKQLRCIDCGHPQDDHPTGDGCPQTAGCSQCGCNCRNPEDFEQVTLHRYRVHNEWIYEAASEDEAKGLFADAAFDFAPDADVEQLPDDDGEITCPTSEWHRIDTEDIQEVAQDLLDRPLRKEELRFVSKLFPEALQWREAVQVCIEEGVSSGCIGSKAE